MAYVYWSLWYVRCSRKVNCQCCSQKRYLSSLVDLRMTSHWIFTYIINIKEHFNMSSKVTERKATWEAFVRRKKAFLVNICHVFSPNFLASAWSKIRVPRNDFTLLLQLQHGVMTFFILQSSKFENVLDMFFSIISWNKSDHVLRPNCIKFNGDTWMPDDVHSILFNRRKPSSGLTERQRDRGCLSTSLQFSNSICSLTQS